MIKRLRIIDTTLRDGEQSARVAFSQGEKLQLARALDHLGVDVIEAGIPISGKKEQETIARMLELELNAEILTWNRLRREDIEASAITEVKNVHISVPSSDLHLSKKLRWSREKLLSEFYRILEYAHKKELCVSIGAEDASRADPDFLIRLFTAAISEGVRRIRYADTVSALNPFLVEERISDLIDRLCEELDWSKDKFHSEVLIDFHGHNDLGMATANAVGAFRAGAYAISCAVNGLGERAGNTALEEIVMALYLIEGVSTKIRVDQLVNISRRVEEYSGRRIAENKPIVGEHVFSHESGIHIDGLLKDKQTYAFLEPSILGRNHQFYYGKYSGKVKGYEL